MKSRREIKFLMINAMKKNKGLLVLPAVHNIEEIINGISTPIQLTKGTYSDLEFRFIDGEVSLIHRGIDIKDFLTVWLSSSWDTRDLAFAVKLYLEHFGIPYTHVEKVTSKITDQLILSLNNISMPNTFFINEADISNYIEVIESICGYPLIIKETQGSGGKNAALVQSRSELIEKSAKLPKHRKYIYQKFIPNDYDWGVLVANGKIVCAEQRYHKKDEFRNNCCNGGSEVFIDVPVVPAEIRAMALKASSALKLSWCRSDIIVDGITGTPYMMEVNRFPGITSGSEEVCGAQNFLEEHLMTL